MFGTRRWIGVVIGLIGLASACGSQEEQAPAPSAEGGEGTIGEGGGNTAGTGGAAGSDQPTAGGDGGAPAGEGGTAGVSDAGEPAGGTDAGVGGTGGSAGGAGGTGGMAEPPPPCPKPDGQICHDFFAADDAAHRLLYVSEFEPSRSWSVDVGDDGVYSPRQLELVDNAQATTGKAVLVSLSTGYAEFDATDGTELARVDSFETVSGAARLAEGNTALGMVNTIHIVDASGELVRSFGLPGAGALGMLHVTDQEEYWFCRLNYIFMADSRPGEIWRGNIPTGGRAEAVLPLGSGADGGALASTGPVATIGEYGPQSGVPPIKQLGRVGSAHQDVGLEYFMGFDLLPNGNVVVANWLGEVEEPSEMAPHLVELTSENELVWQWGDQAAARQIANVLVVR